MLTLGGLAESVFYPFLYAFVLQQWKKLVGPICDGHVLQVFHLIKENLPSVVKMPSHEKARNQFKNAGMMAV